MVLNLTICDGHTRGQLARSVPPSRPAAHQLPISCPGKVDRRGT